MEEETNGDPATPVRPAAPDAPGEWPDDVLVAHLRAGDPRAAVELYERMAPTLLREARREGVDAGLRHEVVMDTIGSVALTLVRPTTQVPRSLTGYMVTALRWRTRRLAKAARRREREECDLGDAASVPEASGPSAGAAASQLAAMLEQHLRADEHDLLTWLGERVPQREIAGWLGLSHAAVRVRVLRLRDRLREVTRRYVAALPDAERATMERYLERIVAVPRATISSTGRAPGGRRHGASTQDR